MSLEDTISHILRDNARDLISGNLDDVCRKIAGAARSDHGPYASQLAADIRSIDTLLDRCPALENTLGRIRQIQRLVELANDASRFEQKWREVLKAEQDGSDSYVRIRKTIGALNVPADWTPPIESSTQDKVWSYTEYQAQCLAERLSTLEYRVRNALIILNEPDRDA